MKRSIKLNALKNKSDELSINQRPMAERAGAKNVAVWGETRIDECIEVLTLFFLKYMFLPLLRKQNLIYEVRDIIY